MKVVELSPLHTNSNKDTKTNHDWLMHLRMILKYGWHWYQAYQAQDKMIRILKSVLDQRFVLIRGFKLEKGAMPFPPLLIGPPGIYLLYIWPKSGIYRIRENQWEIMHSNSRRYRPGKPNVIEEVLQMTEQVTAFVANVLGKPVTVTPLMVFPDTGADVASVRPAVRPLLLDGLKRYAAQLTRSETLLTPTDMVNFVEAVRPRSVPLEKTSQRTTPRRRFTPKQAPHQMEEASRYVNFTPWQWATLGILAFAVLAVSILAIVYVLMTAH